MLLLPGSQFGCRRQPLPARLRADRPAGRARAAGGARRRDPALTADPELRNTGARSGARPLMRTVWAGRRCSGLHRPSMLGGSPWPRPARPVDRTTSGSRNGKTHPIRSCVPARPEIQPFGTLRRLPIGLPDKAKVQELRARSTRSWPTRWSSTRCTRSITGSSPARPSTSSICSSTSTPRSRPRSSTSLPSGSRALGGIAVGDPRHAAELTTIPRPPDGAEEVAVMIDRTLAGARDRHRQGPRRRSRPPRSPRTGAPTTC